MVLVREQALQTVVRNGREIAQREGERGARGQRRCYGGNRARKGNFILPEVSERQGSRGVLPATTAMWAVVGFPFGHDGALRRWCGRKLSDERRWVRIERGLE